MRAQPRSARGTACALVCAGVLLASCSGRPSHPGSTLASATPSIVQTPSPVVTPAVSPTVGPSVGATAPAFQPSQPVSPTVGPTAASRAPVYQPPPNALPPYAHLTFGVPLHLYESPDPQAAKLGTLAAGTDTQAWGALLVDGERWYELGVGPGYARIDLAAAGFSLAPVNCPTGTPNLATVVSLSPWEQLACYGSRELVLEGYEIVGFGGAFPGTWEPGWLAYPLGLFAVTPTLDGDGGALFAHIKPGTGVDISRPAVPSGSGVGTARLRLTGHFNDEASSTCRITDYPYTEDGAGPTADFDPIETELGCREYFVLTGFEVVGQ